MRHCSERSEFETMETSFGSHTIVIFEFRSFLSLYRTFVNKWVILKSVVNCGTDEDATVPRSHSFVLDQLAKRKHLEATAAQPQSVSV